MTLNSGWLFCLDEAVCALKPSQIVRWISAGGEAAIYTCATRIEVGSRVGLGVGA